jgi:hypothetical protein
MLKTCSECKSQQIADKTASFYYVITAILGVIGAVLVFVAWPWSFLVLTGMLVSVVLAVDLPKRTYRCKNCGHEWHEGYNPSGDSSVFTPADELAQ